MAIKKGELNGNGACEAKPPGILNTQEKAARPTTSTFSDVDSNASGPLSGELATHDSQTVTSAQQLWQYSPTELTGVID